MFTPSTIDDILGSSPTSSLRLARFAVVDGTLRKLMRCREQITPALGRSCAAFVEVRGWKFYGASSAANFATERLQRTSRWMYDLATIGRGLAAMPALELALSGGGLAVGDEARPRPIGRSKAVLLCRVATADSLAAWVRLALDSTFKAFRAAVQEARAAGSAWPPGTPETTVTRTSAPGSGPTHPTDATDAAHAAQADDEASRFEHLTLTLPGGVRVVFDETLDLHRAVSGADVPLPDFVAALVAEVHAGLAPPAIDGNRLDFERHLLQRSRTTDLERHMEQISGNWSYLDATDIDALSRRRRRRLKADRQLDEACDTLVRRSLETCDRLQAIACRPTTGHADTLYDRITELLRLDDAIERAIGELLGWIAGHRVLRDAMFGSVGHYAEERLGMGRRDAQQRAFVHRGLSRFPFLKDAYDRGRLGLEATSLVLRILTPCHYDGQAEVAWLARARDCTVKRLRDEARIVKFDWLDDLANQDPPLPADDETWFRSLARFPGRTRKRLDRLSLQHPDRPPLETQLTLRLPSDLADDFAEALEDRRRRAAEGLPSTPAATRLAQTFSASGATVPMWVGLLALLEEYTATWDAPGLAPRRQYDKIYAAWGWRCAVPGCTRRCSIEAHHIEYRSHCGTDHPSNLVPMCAVHHRQGEHGTLLRCRGKAPQALRWRLGHRSVGSWFSNETRSGPRRRFTVVYPPGCPCSRAA